MPKKSSIKIGGEYGRLKVISETGKDRHGHRTFEYRCDCGNTGNAISSFLLSRDDIRCRKCAEKEIGQSARIEMLGKIINGWEVLTEAGVNEHGQFLFLCKCTLCGVEKIKNGSTIRHIKSKGCIDCPPEYKFSYDLNRATGILPDGTKFCVDEGLVSSIAKIRWHKNKKGYIVSTTLDKPKVYLHRFVLGVEGDIIVDHINRDKTDCRKENLRVCNVQQNAWNKGLQRNNTTGYVGVSYINRRDLYFSRISYQNKDLTLGMFKDVVKAAQAHNIAADFFFGEYMGHINDVPIPDETFESYILEKCNRYKNRIETVEKQPVSFLLPDLLQTAAMK